MAKSEATNSGCFSDILRRMMCAGSVPTHPSDHFTDPHPTNLIPNQDKEQSKKPEIQAKTGPSVVARLMGLDSLPADTNWVPNGRARDSFSRSRSVNFADYMLKFNINEPHQQQHRRVRTSVSFREVPASFQPQNQDFLVVYLDNVDDYSKETTKPEMGFEKAKQGKKKKNEKITRDQSLRMKNKIKENEKTSNKISKLKNEPRRKVLPQTSKNCKQNGAKVLGSVLPYKKNFQNDCGVNLKTLKPENRKKIPEKVTKKRKNHHATMKIQPVENTLENLNPVSVLDEVYDLLIQQESLFSGEHLRPINSNLKTESEAGVSYINDIKLISPQKNDCGKIEQRELAADYIELAEQLRRLTEQDLSQSYWISNTTSKNEKPHFERFEEICMDFEQPILDFLLHDVISELVEIS